MYRILFVFLIASTFICAKSLDIQIEASYAVMINAETGNVLFEKNARQPIYPASTTKIASLLYLLKQLPPDLEGVIAASKETLERTTEAAKKITSYALPSHLLEVDGTMIYLREKETLSIKDLLRSMMVASANDSANVLAAHVSSDIPTFMGELNEMVRDLGCKTTHFCNPHGLHHPDHISTAYELAIIMKEALKYPFFCEIASLEKFIRPKTNFRAPQEHKTSVMLLRKDSQFYYPKAICGKTGTHKAAKNNFVVAGSNGERTVIVVLCKVEKRASLFRDAIHLFESAFKEKKEKRLLFKAGEFLSKKIVPRGARILESEIAQDVYLEYFPSEEPEVNASIEWLEKPLPIHIGDHVADVIIAKEDGTCLLKAPLLATNNVKMKFRYKLIANKGKLFALVLLLTLVPLARFVYQMKKREKEV